MSQTNTGPDDLIPLRPLHDHIVVDIIDRGDRITPGGVHILDDNFKEHGVRPRKALVLASSDNARVEGILPGQTVLIEHGGWSRNHGLEMRETLTGKPRKLWMSDIKFVLGTFEG